jgi:hypothetical protein
MEGVGRRVAHGLLAWVIVLGVMRAVVLQPERCTEVSPEQIRHAAEEAIAWSVRTQAANGKWIYRYDARNDRDAGIYEMVRHAGLVMALYQADAKGYDDAKPAADRGLRYASSRFLERDGWTALAGDDRNAWVSTGASALLLAGLTYRLEATGEPVHDTLMDRLGRFLTTMVEPNGAVAAYWDPQSAAPVPDTYSPFFTGEAFWALARMHTLFPEAGWDEPAHRIARYLATERDEAEDWFPDVPDHWAAYGFAEMARWPGHPDGAALDDDMRAYARKIAQLESMQIRYESQRTGSLWSVLTRGPTALGAGVGTIGEALTMLERTPGLDTPEVRERTACTISLLVRRQIDAERATRYPNPPLVQGTWLSGGVTQIDDQQHALSALILQLVNLERAEARP